MQHHDVYEGFSHDTCFETGFCKVCGLHRSTITDNGYKCRFSLNLVAISHLRAKAIKAERAERTQRFYQKILDGIRKPLDIGTD